MIIAILGEKGGTGKTTFATNLAGMRAIEGNDVLIVDADRQGSASYWAEARVGKGLTSVSCVQKFGGGLARAVRDMARRYHDIVIDIAAGDSTEIVGALRAADIAIIPVQPAGLDIWTLGVLDEHVNEAQVANENLKTFVVINRASTNPRDNDTQEAQEAVEACDNLLVADFVVKERVAIKRAAPAGMVVCEYKPIDTKATEEISQVYKLAFGEKYGSQEATQRKAG